MLRLSSPCVSHGGSAIVWIVPATGVACAACVASAVGIYASHPRLFLTHVKPSPTACVVNTGAGFASASFAASRRWNSASPEWMARCVWLRRRITCSISRSSGHATHSLSATFTCPPPHTRRPVSVKPEAFCRMPERLCS